MIKLYVSEREQHIDDDGMRDVSGEVKKIKSKLTGNLEEDCLTALKELHFATVTDVLTVLTTASDDYLEFLTNQKTSIALRQLHLDKKLIERADYEHRAYYSNNNHQITHFYNNMSDRGVPIWALFEVLTMGDFGYLLSCLTYDTRDAISKKLGLNLPSDTSRQLIHDYIYALKDLRNAVAHNAVIFDTRYRRISPTKAMKSCLINEIGLPYVNFKTIGDYLILVCYYLKLLKVNKTTIKAFIR